MQVQETTPQTFIGLIKLSKNVFGRSWGAGNGSQQCQLDVALSFWWLPQGGLQIRQIQLEKGDNERSRGTEAETHDWNTLI